MERDYQMPSGNSWSSGLSDVDLGGSTTGSDSCEALPQPPPAGPADHRGPASANGKKKAAKSAKVCGVCGDLAKSFHFGGLSCDSCKAFFRRSVQNDNYLSFQCAGAGNCPMALATRKTCQYCRIKSCFRIGPGLISSRAQALK